MRRRCAIFLVAASSEFITLFSASATFAAWMIFGTAAPAWAEESYAHYHICEIESECRVGNRVEDEGFSNEPWKPFETENLFVWVADVCLGYFMTRSPESWNGGVVTALENTSGSEKIVERGDHTKSMENSARVTILNYPFGKYGVFSCSNEAIPSLRFEADEFRRWTDSRLKADEGWKPSSFWGDEAQFRNEEIGAIIRVNSFGGAYSFSLEADYYGPPIIMDRDFPY